MRKITKESIAAFNSSFSFNRQNMTVKTCFGTHPLLPNYKGRLTILSLHGNDIAIKTGWTGKDDHIKTFITNAGWQSNTTKERLNGLNGVSISQKNFVWYLNGREWDGSLIEIK